MIVKVRGDILQRHHVEMRAHILHNPLGQRFTGRRFSLESLCRPISHNFERFVLENPRLTAAKADEDERPARVNGMYDR